MIVGLAPAVEAQELLADPRWPAYAASLEERRNALYRRLTTHNLDHGEMCRIAGELRGLDYALGTPPELARADPRSDA